MRTNGGGASTGVVPGGPAAAIVKGATFPPQDARWSQTAAMRAELLVVATVLAAAGLAWFATVERMAGMDRGPGTALGALGWFTGVWSIMMAAMMLPSLAPTSALNAGLARREPSRILLFTGGYLLVWSAAGVLSYGLVELGRALFAGSLAWGEGGRWVAAGVLALAAGYQLTPFKRAALARCRNPLRSLGQTRPQSRWGSLAMGLRTGGFCLGCSWAIMAALFALGVMSLTWMALIAGLVALEKLGPWPRRARIATALLLLILAVGILAVPHEVPGFVVPGSHGSMPSMRAIGTMG